MIEITNLHKSYRQGEIETRVITGLGLTIESGKSTLLNLIGCLDRPDSGQVTIDGTVVSSLSTKEASRFRSRHPGFIFQDFNLIESFSVFENVEFPLSVILN